MVDRRERTKAIFVLYSHRIVNIVRVHAIHLCVVLNVRFLSLLLLFQVKKPFFMGRVYTFMCVRVLAARLIPRRVAVNNL